MSVELVLAVVALGEGLQVGEQSDGVVVLAGFAGGDHFVNAGPGSCFVVGQFVLPTLTSERPSGFAAGLFLGAAGGFAALPFGADASGGVE
jgi:hypothetical protein